MNFYKGLFSITDNITLLPVESNEDPEGNQEEKLQSTLLLKLALQVVICCFILIGNSLILVVMRSNKVMNRITRLLIGNLAVLDLCFGIGVSVR